MSKRIYVGDKSSKQGYWTSFESNMYLAVTRKNIYQQCVPCIENLLDQLVDGKQLLELNQAFDCWKVVALLDDEIECLELLQVYEERFLSVPGVRGRFGSREQEGKKAVIFHTDSKEERDIILWDLKRCVIEVKPQAEVFFTRACTSLHGQVLGDGSDWNRITPIKHPDNIAEVIKRCRKSLYDW